MPSKTCPANKSSLFAVTGSTELGGGQDRHLPVGGPWNGYTFTSAIRFGFDWSDVRRITSATLRVRTSSQVHVGFSSSPDFYVARATAEWTANSASGSGEGGSGWSTSPTVYPGPPTTTTGRVSKRSSTSEGVDVLVDVTAIVRAWAPVAVEGGGGAPNYGLVLSRVASGDVTEFASYADPSGSLRPYITLAYETDSPPPAPTIVAPPSGATVTTVRPTLTAVAVDPDGDPIEVGDLEVKQGATVVYSASTGGSLTHVPTTDLPPGALTQRWRARANGVYGAWSADTPFTVDRLPTVTGFSAPPASVSGTRRPVITFATSDADGDLVELWDLEVYGASAGAPVGSAAYAKTNQTTGITGSAGAQTVTHTPTADLPIGDVVIRSRVRTRGVWSAWSAYRASTIVVALPAIVWYDPPADGGFLSVFAGEWTNPATVLGAQAHRVLFNAKPPAGFTLTKCHVKVTRLDGPTPGSVYVDADVAVPAAGGDVSQTVRPNTGAGAWWPTQAFGRVQIDVTLTASNAGVTNATRFGRLAFGEWLGAIALGDSVSGLAVVETPKLDQVAVAYRAQSSVSAANGAAPWRAAAQIATVQGELPATNAYLGVRTRIARLVDDVNLIVNGDLETGSLPPWIVTGTGVGIGTDANAPAGPKIIVVNGDGGPSNPGVAQKFPVVAGATYRCSAWGRMAAGSGKARLQMVTRNAAGSIVSSSALIVETALSAWTFLDGLLVIPADGSVASVDFILRIPTTVATDSVRFDGATFVGPTAGDGGFDKLCVDWTSLG